MLDITCVTQPNKSNYFFYIATYIFFCVNPGLLRVSVVIPIGKAQNPKNTKKIEEFKTQ